MQWYAIVMSFVGVVHYVRHQSLFFSLTAPRDTPVGYGIIRRLRGRFRFSTTYVLIDCRRTQPKQYGKTTPEGFFQVNVNQSFKTKSSYSLLNSTRMYIGGLRFYARVCPSSWFVSPVETKLFNTVPPGHPWRFPFLFPSFSFLFFLS